MNLISRVPGYLVKVLFNNVEIPYENMGMLNREKDGVFTIKLVRDASRELPFHVSGVYRVSKDKNIEMVKEKNGTFKAAAKMRLTSTNSPYVPYHFLRFLGYNDKGEVCEYEVTIFSQKGCHYFHMNRNWKSQLVRDENGKAALLGVDWPQMLRFVEDRLGLYPTVQLADLPPLVKPDVRPLKDDEAIVEWFKPSLGIGVLKTALGLAKVHYSNLKLPAGKPAYLVPGELVRAKVVPMDIPNSVLPYKAKEVYV